MKISTCIFVTIEQTIVLNPSLTLDAIIQLSVSYNEEQQKPVWDMDIMDYDNFIYNGVKVKEWKPIKEFYATQLNIDLNKEVNNQINAMFTKTRIQSIVDVLLTNPLNMPK
jgi:hypothetical protein